MNNLHHNRHKVLAGALGALFFSAPLLVFAQDGNREGEWPSYAADSGSTKYTSLSQIDETNFAELEIAWRWKSIDADLNLGELVEGGDDINFGRLQATPLMVDGVLYMLTALNQVAAMDAASGTMLWSHDPQVYLSGPSMSPLGFHHRGVAYWGDGEQSRILLATNDGYITSLDADTGSVDENFAGGRIDMTDGIPRAQRDVMDWQGAQPVGSVSPPVVVGDTLVVQQITSNRPHFKERPPTWIRGYDIPTGELKWTFHGIPQQGEFGVETWQEESWRYTGNGGVWTQMSADLELGYIYLPMEAPTNDFYGGHRPGDNLFTQSLVALDADTGERVWHFQMVHHGIWDYDTPAAPNLMDITVDGREIKAIAQVTKQGFTYVFDRATGVPVWPIIEREVPPSTIPGERASPTQPFPTKPPAFAPQGLTIDDLIDFTPELRAEAIEILNAYTYGPIFTPPTLPRDDGHRGTILRPGAGGGANWPGAGIDPKVGVLFIPSADNPTVPFMGTLAPGETNFNYYRLANQGVRGPQGLPLLKPPYATITAIDMNDGEILWQVANGDGSARVENNPAVEGVDLPPLGGGGRHPVLVTSTLLIHAQNTSDGPKLIARDKSNGQELASIDLPANASAAPMSFSVDDKQFIALSVSGQPAPELVVYALP
ncbi:MAG: pyrroloquinoline quinone-dependent dehydrogenase [SAR86 cluster bacterium]|uniref:Pyrroloquinoline quinone-dependent dehydrogenase n=1 Tax=SAR86 cluster bacterium TaxID=2030880 RepID=A0A2A4X628_9GAMM|nr:MAG: pyrroloquinoline quinone-dependent dehydrogenase [SAR86 cluster bacterium]